MLSELAQGLNRTLNGSVVDALLSETGRRMYFPNGIIAQSGEAKKAAAFANGTIGMTVVEGEPALLPSIQKCVPSFSAGELVAYAPTAGLLELREAWKAQMVAKNPLLSDKAISLPIVVPGITAGLSDVIALFCDKTKPLVAPAPSWDNYALIAEAQCNAELHRFPMFKNGAFNLAGLEAELQNEAEERGSVRLLLNFPQNPSGYSPTHEETLEICRIVKSIAERGAKLLIINDDAYWGLNYETSIETQSLFAHLADIHENVLAVKIDGPTKEDFVWGFRCGFVTFAAKNLGEAQRDALVQKFLGIIRATVSCSATPSQSILLRVFNDAETDEQKARLRTILERRYRAVKNFIAARKSNVLTPLPFNSGYFMSFHTEGIDAEKLRKTLLATKGIGTIAIDAHTLRVAFSSIDEEKIDATYSDIYEVAADLAAKR